MKIVIAGCGTIGKNIINNFIKAGHFVVVIDQSREAIRDISGMENVNVILGNACNVSVLEQADIQNTACFIAVTPSDSTNIISCSLAKKLFRAPMTMALVKDDFIADNEYLFKENFSLDHLLNPDEEIAQNLYELVHFNDIYDYAEIDGMSVLEIKCNPGSDISNTPLKHLKNVFHDIDIKVISISRNCNMSLFPRENDTILEDDIVYLATHTKDITKVMATFGIDSGERSIAIIGINPITRYLLQKLKGRNVVAIDSAKEQLLNLNAEMRLLDDNPINTLNDIKDTDTLICAMPDDHQNVLLALAARKIGINRVIALSHDNVAYNNLISPKGHGVIVDFKNSVFSKILDILYVDEYIPLKHAEVAISILDIPEASQYVGNRFSHVFDSTCVMPLFVKSNSQLTAIDRNYTIMPNDRLILVVLLGELKRIGLQNMHI